MVLPSEQEFQDKGSRPASPLKNEAPNRPSITSGIFCWSKQSETIPVSKDSRDFTLFWGNEIQIQGREESIALETKYQSQKEIFQFA